MLRGLTTVRFHASDLTAAKRWYNRAGVTGSLRHVEAWRGLTGTDFAVLDAWLRCFTV
ncbi:hypothetical protein [[Kitasatospora] papulosa]|uniref:hypothetical protein n=1 Tax=[Kitasatospora] papulosa TaxID=1464011 RepID=UPI003673A227